MDAHKPIVNYEEPTTPGPHGWNCPYCNGRIRLTWKRYFTEPGLRKKCPHCGKQSKLNKSQSWKLWTIRFADQVACGVPLGLVVFLFFGPVSGFVAFLLGGLIAGIPIDRYIDEKFRQLEPLED